MVPLTKTIGELYSTCKHTDNFMYIYVEKEITFG